MAKNKNENNLLDKVKKQHYDRKDTNNNVDSEFSKKQKNLNEAFKNSKKDDLVENIIKIKNDIFKTYIPFLDDDKIYTPLKENFQDINYLFNIRIIKITKWVTEKNENALDKLKNVYSALSRPYTSFAMVADRTMYGTDLYFVLINTNPNENDPAIVDSLFELFTSALRGNFPGVEFEEVKDIIDKSDDTLNNTIADFVHTEDSSYDFNYKVKSTIEKWIDNTKSVAMVTNIPSEKSENFKSQGIEKLLDGIVPISQNDEYTLILLANSVQNNEISKKEEIFSEYHSIIYPYISWQESDAVGSLHTKTSTQSSTTSVNASISIPLGDILGLSAGAGYSKTLGISKTEGRTEQKTLSLNHTDYSLEQTKEKIETQIERLQNGASLGMWHFATYILSKDYAVANNVANMYRSLTQGDDSYIEYSSANSWNVNKRGESEYVEIINSYLKVFQHPVFEKVVTPTENFLPEFASGCTCINGTEIAMAMNMPNAAVSGLPVIECAEFGRDVISQHADYKPEINIGNIFHMQKEEPNKAVALDSRRLTEHLFITGSTGAGKSTTIYRILDESTKIVNSETNKNVTFMVIEPAKGEYKNELYKHTNVPITVYGTNPNLSETELLRINPFSFPSHKIHILEHLDRLIEIFNVCWPMYAAMPAVLKKGIEDAYKASGWDLLKSQNAISNSLFPTFTDVCNCIRNVIENSDYSADNKGDYKGALVTRIESLTNGINGLIFVADEIPENKLFEENTIVDLSRVGSLETKALIMGLLIMKLQEYRIANAINANSPLKHITVLEEAHNLLKRTSTEQNTEGANLLGKSVEMLSNSIAEMRTYGEAFIIADQAPGLLDMSVIRNTNTKIIMRLPDFSDRELVGKSANLNDDQIIEIAKLKPGVAAVYYNGWINPVLCKVAFNVNVIASENVNKINASEQKQFDSIHPDDLLLSIFNPQLIDDVDSFKSILLHSGLSGEFIAKMHYFCGNNDEKDKKKMIPSLVYSFFNAHRTLKRIEKLSDPTVIRNIIIDELTLSELTHNNKQLEDIIICNLIHEHYRLNPSALSVDKIFCEYCEKLYNI